MLRLIEAQAEGLQSKVISKSIDLMHAFMQDRPDADVTIAELPPIDEVPLISEDITINPELGRHWARHHLMRLNLAKGIE